MAGDSLIDRNGLINGYNDINLKEVNVKHYGVDKMYMDNDVIRDKFKERKITPAKFCFTLLKEIHPILRWKWKNI